ncbi:MAG: DUF434 domain-containing protein [Bacteroidales bacterium]|nr:DUF434 domain-containing protein [Bacteroidales bacterium]MCF8344102.1 DUF434 domain-containing protein [Bacteroidales bacterium]
MIISKDFKAAVQDYFCLMNKAYPDRGSVKFVGDRYGLSGSERSMLFRGVHARSLNDKRKKKLISDRDLHKRPLHIDSFNALLTIISYLEGKPIFLSTDGLLRDASEWHGKSIQSGRLKQALEALFDFLKANDPGYLNFYIDEPMHESGMIYRLISEKLEVLSLKGKANRFPYSDDILQRVRDGYLTTSDSQIIDKSSRPVFDLAKAVLDYKFNPRFFELTKIIS